MKIKRSELKKMIREELIKEWGGDDEIQAIEKVFGKVYEEVMAIINKWSSESEAYHITPQTLMDQIADQLKEDAQKF